MAASLSGLIGTSSAIGGCPAGPAAPNISELDPLLDTRDAFSPPPPPNPLPEKPTPAAPIEFSSRLLSEGETAVARISAFTGAAAAATGGGDFSRLQPQTPSAIHAKRNSSRRSMASLPEFASAHERPPMPICGGE